MMSVTTSSLTGRDWTARSSSSPERRSRRGAAFTLRQRSVALRHTLLLRLMPSPRLERRAHLALLLPFAFQRVLLARLLPAGLRRARYYVGS
ncbi:MAG: hypothetical protein L0387_24805, partial [Acidobacteria bacterium]|nr:hypothetical protein [Acidobacteriota bacterium]MCI0718564.1 hypothetical protein [Acidobacteriota bacterium]